ncbi:MAG: lactate racemase domain-containing protein [Bacillota bacterium]
MTETLLAAEQNLQQALSPDQLLAAVRRSLAPFPKVKSVLLLHPDYSRTDFTDVLFRLIYQTLAGRGLRRLDTLNAAGTHRPMSEKEKLAKLGIENRAQYPLLREMADHRTEPSELVSAGEISAAFMSEKTQGRWPQAIPVKINARLRGGYDLIIAISGTVPHEAAGFAGGLKVFFPGVSGNEVIDGLHWAAVQMGIPRLIGQIDNPGRDVINEGAKCIFAGSPVPMLSFNMVFHEDDHAVVPHGLYAGVGYQGFIAAYNAAARASSHLHIVRIDRPLDAVVQSLGDGYDEVWTAGKGSYKLQSPGVMAPGGEIIIYQPKIHCFHSNPRMDHAIRAIGYHSLDYVLHWLESNPGFDRNVAAHVINVRGGAEYDRALRRETNFAFRVTLATGVSEEQCRSVGLGYRDPDTLEREFQKMGGNKLWIKNGGKMLYALQR